MKYQVAKGRGLQVGGNANNGANDGLAYLNVNNGPANANANIGSRLYCLFDTITNIFRTHVHPLWTLPLGKR